jgi:hypothetical protein
MGNPKRESELNIHLPKVTRLEIIDEHGRDYINGRIASIQFSVQDDARTLKIFITEKDYDG